MERHRYGATCARLSGRLREPTLLLNLFIFSRYVDEQVFRYNNRATKQRPPNDSDPFKTAMSQALGHRLGGGDANPVLVHVGLLRLPLRGGLLSLLLFLFVASL